MRQFQELISMEDRISFLYKEEVYFALIQVSTYRYEKMTDNRLREVPEEPGGGIHATQPNLLLLSDIPR